MDSIGRYDIQSVMGSGSFATVYKALDPRLESVVAVKVLAENWSHQPDVRARFRQEAVLLRRCQTAAPGSNLVEVFDIDETDDGRPFFVMPIASGGSLETRTQGGAPIPPKFVLPVINMLERSLATLHRSGIIHRDVKPSNLLIMSSDRATEPRMPGALVGPGERLVLGDLGLAKEMLDDGSALTIAGGTPKFMAPEQRDPAAKLDARADLFGATAVIAELLTGSPDYPGDDIVGSAVGAQLRKGLSQNAEERHISAAEWGASLRSAIGPDPATRSTSLPAPGPVHTPPPAPSSAVPAHPTAPEQTVQSQPAAQGQSRPAESQPAQSQPPGSPSSDPARPASPQPASRQPAHAQHPGAPAGTDAVGDQPGGVPSGNGDLAGGVPPSQSKTGPDRSMLGAVVLGVLLLLGAFGFGITQLTGSGSVSVDGPTSVSVGEPITLRADVPEGSTYEWTVGDQMFRNQDVQLTPRSVGVVTVELTATTADGVETTTHRVTVTE